MAEVKKTKEKYSKYNFVLNSLNDKSNITETKTMDFGNLQLEEEAVVRSEDYDDKDDVRGMSLLRLSLKFETNHSSVLTPKK